MTTREQLRDTQAFFWDTAMASWLNDFGPFGLSFGAGALLGYFASFLMMGHFYDFRNERVLPEITIHFHWQLLLALVILPTTFFMLLAIGYARRQLQTPALRL